MTHEVEARFRRVERVLDGLVSECAAALRATGISVGDESNRTGFDWAGPYYRWCYLFEDIARAKGMVERVAVWVEYVEPWEPSPETGVTLRRLAEVFAPGQSPLWKDDTRQVLALDELQRTTLPVVTHSPLGCSRRSGMITAASGNHDGAAARSSSLIAAALYS